MHRACTLVCLLLSLLGAVAGAWGDIIIEQDTTSPMGPGKRVMKVRPGLIRIEQPGANGGSVVMLCNPAADEMITLMPQQKMAMRQRISLARQKNQAREKQMGIDPAAIQFTPTGQKERVGVWDTEVYQMNQGGLEMKVWIAKDFPNMQKYRDAMTQVSRAASGGSLDPNTFDLPGMVIKSAMASPMGPYTITVVSIKEGIVPDSEYAVPPGYRPLDVSTGPGM